MHVFWQDSTHHDLHFLLKNDNFWERSEIRKCKEYSDSLLCDHFSALKGLRMYFN